MSTDHAPTSARGSRRRPGGAGHDPSGGSRRSGYVPDVDDDYDDWDDPELDGAAPRILWGRIAFFGGALLLAFILGRVTADGSDQAAEAALTRVDELTTELEQARAEIDALEAGGTQGAGSADASPPDTGAASDGDEAAEAGAAEDSAANDTPDAAAAEDEAPAENEAGESAAAPDTESAATTYTVQPGDYLFGLAERFYNNGRLWQVIAEANDLGPGAVISPGQTLTIPPAP